MYASLSKTAKDELEDMARSHLSSIFASATAPSDEKNENRSSTLVLQFMSLDGVGNRKAGNSVGDGSAKGDTVGYH
jgi:hypothetical protein